jgi:ribosome-binding factor A
VVLSPGRAPVGCQVSVEDRKEDLLEDLVEGLVEGLKDMNIKEGREVVVVICNLDIEEADSVYNSIFNNNTNFYKYIY